MSPTAMTKLGRVIDFLEQSGQLDNTIIVAVSDNGASGEGDPTGRSMSGGSSTVYQRRPSCRWSTSMSWAARRPTNHYNTGWAWAFDTPFPYWKRWAGYEGGVADMCLVSGRRRSQPTGAATAVRPRSRRGAHSLRTPSASPRRTHSRVSNRAE